MHPKIPYGYANKIWDTTEDAHERVQNVPSEYGKFCTIVMNTDLSDFRDKSMSFGIVRDLSNQIYDNNYTRDRCVAMGIATKDRGTLNGRPPWKTLFEMHAGGMWGKYETHPK